MSMQAAPGSSSSPYGGSKLSVMSSPSAAAVQQLSAVTGMSIEAAALAAGSAASCAELEQIMQACKAAPGGMSQAAGAAVMAGKQVLANMSAECVGVSMATDEQGHQGQQAAATTINSCFGFLKTATRW